MAEIIGNVPGRMDAAAATIGMFDGVHRGHLWLIEQLRRFADARGLRSAVVTFANHPQNVLRPNSGLRLIMPLAERLRLIAATGVDYIVVMNFTTKLSQLDSRGFMSLLQRDYSTRAILMGYNHRFGHNRNEQFQHYLAHGRELQLEVERAEEYIGAFAPVSSSIVRRQLEAGDVAGAADKLGRRFGFTGSVNHGFARGRGIGFPTANVVLPSPLLLVPRDGVYAVEVTLPDGSRRGGMANIGTRPTFDDGSERSIEVHIIDFEGNLYGRQIKVDFCARLRDERHMSGIDELRTQLTADLAATKLILGKQL